MNTKPDGVIAPYIVSTWTGKSGKTGEHFPVREKSGNFNQTGKVRELVFTQLEISILENWGNLSVRKSGTVDHSLV